ncbi:YtxH domain-containing protein [Hymenobacter metallilatus]|uniref:YtxH domain-containing protein n=1 Tax=Hymenobacter metallilatus TaxID=2493666 RepID=A0A3R9N173_9BACT|nr:YtxH domain-containing protein [Hymenobacter metallilatus]RSK36115.1 YtxH domain-containing protein [Hymenobacter metallilatus]
MQDTKGKVILSLLAGATAGIVAGLLLAPETGEEARTNLKKSASRVGDDLSKLLKEGKNRLDALKGQAPADSEQHHADRSAANALLDSLDQPGSAAYPSDDDLDYDGTGSDSRHFPGYKA